MSNIILSNHAKFRLFERGIDVREVKRVAKNGNITKVEINGIIIKKGICPNGQALTVISKNERNTIVILTAYYEHNSR